MTFRFRMLTGSSLRVGALKLARGTVLSQAVIVAATPLLTRAFSPQDFGTLAYFSSLYAILVGVSTLKLELSILLPKQVQKSEALTLLTIALSGSLCLLLLLGLILANFLVARVAWVFFFLPFALFAGAALSLGQQWSSREKEFSNIGTSLLVNSIVNVSFCGLFYLAGMAEGGLVISYVLGLAAGSVYIGIRRRRVVSGVAAARREFKGSSALKLFGEYRNFPLHVLPNTILVSLTYTALPILMSRFFDTGAIGLYSVANRFLVLPSILVGAAVGDVFRSEFVSRLHCNADFLGLFRKTLIALTLFATPVFLGVWLCAPVLFHIVFGQKFVFAGELARYLCLGVAGNFFVQIFTYVFIALGKTREGLFLQILLSIGPLLGFCIGAIQHDIRLAFLYMSLVSFCASALFIFVAYRLATRHVAHRAVELSSPPA